MQLLTTYASPHGLGAKGEHRRGNQLEISGDGLEDDASKEIAEPEPEPKPKPKPPPPPVVRLGDPDQVFT
jgi:hypothetical protein